MFKKLSKVLLSLSLSVLACGGIFSAVNFKGGVKADGPANLTATVGGTTYTLEAKEYGTGSDKKTFYVIDTVEDMSLVSYMVSVVKNGNWAEYNYELANDINLGSRNWTAIGTYDNPYKGIFNGNGYTINGLNASKSACESEVFYNATTGSMISSPADGSYYKTNSNVYYKYESDKGYVLQTSTPSGDITDVTVSNYYYYGLFGKISGAEISDVVMGKGCYAYRNNDEGVTAYSGILVAYADGESKFYNIYDSMADADAKISNLTDYYVKSKDTAVDANKTYYTLSGTTYTAVADSSTITNPSASHYERVMRIDTGKYTYYYLQSTSSLSLYREPELTSLAVTIALEDGKIGSFVADDKAYYYDYDATTGKLCLNLKERYIVNSTQTVASEVEGEADTIINSIEVAGTTYYIKTVTGGMELYTTSDFEADTKKFECLNNSTGYVTLGSTTYPYRYENSVFKVLAYSEVCTIGYVSDNTQFYKGNYYRLNSTQYVGIGAINDSAAYSGTINIAGTTYEYVFEIDETTGNSQISLYTDAEYGYALYIGQGNSQGVGTISINNINYLFNYNKTFKDLELSSIGTALTEIPYTVAETGGSVKVETLEQGLVISFNTSIDGTQSSANYYKKGSSDFINSYKMIYDKTVGLSNFDYYNNFVSSTTTLPKEYAQTTDGDYYVVSETAGYKFEYWTVPDATTGVETIVYADATNGLHSYKVTSDEINQSGKTYYSFSDGAFSVGDGSVGATVDIFNYEMIDTATTIANIKANDNQVDAKWSEKSYTFHVEIDGVDKTLTVGYGERWDNIASQINALKPGYDLEMIGYKISSPENEFVAADTTNGGISTGYVTYMLFHDYDNYGNHTTYTFQKTTDTEIVEGTEYYITDDAADYPYKKEYQKVENPTAENLSSYYVKVTNKIQYNNDIALNVYLSYVDSSSTITYPTDVSFTTVWQKQPVNGKMSFSNTTDKYILTSDTAVKTNKSYYTYDEASEDFVLVTNPTTENIATYFEETTKFLDGKFAVSETNGLVGVQTPVSKESGSNWFFKLNDSSKVFGTQFALNAGYSVNYILPADLGVLDESLVGYYLYDEANGALYYVAYDATEEKIVRTPISSDKVIVGKRVSGTEFTKHIDSSTTSTITSFDSSTYYVDTKSTSGFAIVYTYGEDSLVAQTTLYRNGQNFSYTQTAFTVNSYKLYIDIMRDVMEFKVNVSQDSGLNGTATIKVTEDGNPYTVQLVENFTGTQSFKVKYDSNYLIEGTASAGYTIDDSVSIQDMTFNAGYSQGVEEGVFNLKGTIAGLNYNLEIVDGGEDKQHYPTIDIKLVYATFDAFAQYEFADGKYDSSLTSATLPSLNISSKGTGEGQEKNGSLTEFSTDHNMKTTFTSYGYDEGSVEATFTDNDYYKLATGGIKYDVYNCLTGKYTLSAGQFEVTEYNYSAILAKITYNGETCYVLKTDLTGTSGSYSLNDKNIYKCASTNNTANPFNQVNHKDLIIFKVSVEKVKYDVSTLIQGEVSETTLVSLKDYDGEDATTGGNVIATRNTDAADISQFVFGDTICLDYNLNKDAYTFKGYRLKTTTSGVIKIADWTGSEWAIGDNFKAEESSYTKYGTATVVDGKIQVVFNKMNIASFGTKEDDSGSKLGAVICGVFEGKEANIGLSGYNQDGTTYTAYIIDKDGKTSNNTLTPIAYSEQVIKVESSTFNKVKYGDLTAKTLNYEIGENAPYMVKGFACHVVYTSSESQDIILTTFDAATSGTLTKSYKELFEGNADYLKSLFKGDATLYILPILTQKTITVSLSGGTGDGTSGDKVEGLTYYAGGDGLDISGYVNQFTRTGYTAEGWVWIDETTETNKYSITTNLIKFEGVVADVYLKYGGNITISRTWTANTYKVYFDLADGETLDTLAGVDVKNDSETGKKYIEITFDTAYEIPSASKTGYSFNGWKLDSEVFESSGSLYKKAQDVTIKPDFTANLYKVYVSANKGTIGGEANKTETISYDSKILSATVFSSTPTRDGYTFSGWYAYVKEGNTVNAVKIDENTILSVKLNTESVTYVNLNGTEAVLTIMASWTRVSGYYTVANSTSETYTIPYNSLAQTFEAINDVKANGTTILSNGEINPVNNDQVTFTWQYSVDGVTYTNLTDTEKTKYSVKADKLSLTNVAESGYYKVIIKFADTSVALTTATGADGNKYVEFERTIHVSITPLVVSKTLETSYTTTFDTTTSPDLGLVLSTGVNNEKVNITSYEIGKGTAGTFVAGSDADTYTTIRFYFNFAEGYTYVAGNYSNVNGNSESGYYFDQATNITVNPKEVSLTPIVNEIAYTGAKATIVFAGSVTLDGKVYNLSVNAESLAGAFGASGTKSTISISSANFSILDTTKSVSGEGQKVSNYTFTLSGSIDILGENVQNYTFAGKLLTKDSSSEALKIIISEKVIKVDEITFGEASTVLNLTSTAGYEIINMGNISYIYAVNGDDRSLCFQLNNNATEVKVYSMFGISNVKFTDDILTYEKESDTYYMFGYYAIESEGEVETATTTLSNFDGTASQNLSSVANGKTYAIGYTDCVKVTLTALGNDGTASEVKYVKLGSALKVNPERISYTFTGWENTSSDERITLSKAGESSYNDTFTINGTTIAPTTLKATWVLNAPSVGTTNNISRNANEGDDTITVIDILGGDITSKITNYNSSLTYTYEWFNSSSAKISGTDSVTLQANTDSNGTYTLRIYNLTGESPIYTDITFSVQYNKVEIAISNENTTTTKENNFDNVTAKALSDGKFTYDYSFGNAYDPYITINVPASTNANKNYVLSENKSGGNIYFTVTKIKNASGETVSETSATLTNAGTYKITLCYNDKIYSGAESSFEVVINPYTISWNDTSLKALFETTEDEKEAFEKTFGGDNTILTKTIYITNQNVLTMTAPTSGTYLTQKVVFFNNSIDGIKEGEDGVTLGALHSYDITNAKIYNVTSGSEVIDTNYNISITETYPKLYVKSNDSAKVQVTLGSATKVYDGKAIASVKLEWNEEESCYEFNAYTSDNTLVVTFDIKSVVVGGTTSDPTVKSGFELLHYNVNQTGLNIVDAGDYRPSNLFPTEMGKPEGSTGTLGGVEIVDTQLLTISKKNVEITKVTKVCDTNTTFDSNISGHVATITGLVGSETVTVTGTYATTKASDNITVTSLAISGDASKNYTLTNTTVVGEITASSEDVTASITQNSFEYGSLANTTDLSATFTFAFAIGGVTLDNSYIETISEHKIVDKDTGLDVTDVYSTGGFLKAGSYKLSVKFTSVSYSKMNDTQTFEFTITKKEVAPVYETITKVYNGNTTVEQTVTVVTLTGDVVTVNAVYADANVGENKTVNLTLDSADKENYTLTTSTITGAITERDGALITVVNVDNDGVEGFVDNQLASGTGYTSNADNTLSLNVAPYNGETTGSDVMAKLVNPTKAGYTFKGFFTESSCTTALSADNVINLINASIQAGESALTIYAKWEINSYTITEIKGDHTTITITTTTYTYNDSVSFTVSYDDGYKKSLVDIFSTENAGTKTEHEENESEYSFKMPAYNVTIKTEVTPEVYNISYELNGGTISDSKPETHVYGTATSIPNPTREGYTFTGWKVNGTDKSVDVNSDEQLTLAATDYLADITLEAQWQANVYKIYLNITTPETFTDSAKADLEFEDATGKYYYEVTYGTKATLPQASKAGYGFVNWVYSAQPDIVFDQTADYLTANDIELSPVFEAGTYTVNFVTTNVTVAVYNDVATADNLVTPTSGTQYSLTGGEYYVVIVTPSAGYTVSEWAFGGRKYTTQANDLTFVDNTSITIGSTANSNNIEIMISEPAKANCTINVAVGAESVSLDNSVEGKYTFNANTDSTVVVTINVHKGYSLGTVNFYGEFAHTESSVAGAYSYTLTGFTTNISMSVGIVANSYSALIKNDSNNKATIGFNETYVTEVVENGTKVEVSTGKNLVFTTNVESGYKFAGVKFGDRTIAVDTSEDNINETGINISIQNGVVTVTGFVEAFEIELLTAKQAYVVTLNKVALNMKRKNDSTVTDCFTLTINDTDYTAGTKYNFGETLNLVVRANATGYKFVGWFTQIETDGDVITYNPTYKISDNENYSFTMANNEVTYYAVYEISYVKHTLTVMTNDSYDNTKGGAIYLSDEAMTENNVLYKTENTYTAIASQGYKFIGWFYLNGEDLTEATLADGYTIVTTESDLGGNAIKSTIKFSATGNVTLVAKFEAKALSVETKSGLLVRGVLTYPNSDPDESNHVDYGNMVWGTFDEDTKEFTPNTNGTNSTITTRTDDVVYVKVTAKEGFLIEQLSNSGEAVLNVEKVYTKDNYDIYKLSNMNADAGEYKITAVFYSIETTVALNFVLNETPIQAGQIEVEQVPTISISGNRTANVIVTASTNSVVKVRVYTKLGYKFDTYTEGANIGQVVINKTGSLSGVTIATQTPQEPEGAPRLGYTQYTDITIYGYTGGHIEIGLNVIPNSYNLVLKTQNGNTITTIAGVKGGTSIDGYISNDQRNMIKNLEPYEGFSLLGFYPYSNGSGQMFIDAQGYGVISLNDNGYYWTGSAYQTSPYFSIVGGTGTFTLYAVYSIDKTIIELVASPKALETTAPTVGATVVIGNMNNANSWTNINQPLYAEVLYGAKVSATAPKFEGYVFSFWQIERINKNGIYSKTYNQKETIPDLQQDGYTEITLTAVYNVQVRVASTSGGSAEVSGYRYTVNPNGQGVTREEVTITDSSYLSSLDTFTYRATVKNGYTFKGWEDEDGTIISTSTVYEVSMASSAPKYLKAVFEGDAKVLEIEVDSSDIGSIVKVAKKISPVEGPDGMMIDEEEIANWSSVNVKVGDQIVIYMNIPSQEYEAIWKLNDGSVVQVENDFYNSSDYRVYIYTVSADDEYEADKIKIKGSFETREFNVSVSFDLENKVSADELKLAGTVKCDAREISSGYVRKTIYGREVQISISVNKNYKVKSIEVDGIAISLSEVFKTSTTEGVLRLQTSGYDYNWQQSATINIVFEKALWVDEVPADFALDGNGTEENPYKIDSDIALAYVAYMINVQKDASFASAHFELLKDIDFTGKYWSPIGTDANPFKGTFDFNVFEISGITVEYGYAGTTTYSGVFGVTSGANIFKTESNLGLIIGIVAGGLALVGITVGIFLGVRAKRRKEHDKLANS